MRKGMRIVFLFPIFILLFGCVYTKFYKYKLLENTDNNSKYFKEEDIEIGIHTIYSREMKGHLIVSFKKELPQKISIKSYNFGNIDSTYQKDKKIIKEIEVWNIKSDTIYLEINDGNKYKFYLDFENNKVRQIFQ